VLADKIKAESFDGFILVHWEGVTDAASYEVWRREWKTADSAPDEGTITRIPTSPSASAERKIPYFKDTGIKNGTSYQYGVVVNSYKEGGGDAVPKSEIVWQAVSGENPAAAAKGVVDSATTAKTKVDQDTINKVKDAVKAGITYYDQSTSGLSGATQLNDRLAVKISELTLGYTYTIYYQYLRKYNSVDVVDTDWQTTDSNSDNFPSGMGPYDGYWNNESRTSLTYTEADFISHYLDTGSWVYEPVYDFSTGFSDYTGSTSPYRYWKGRLVVKVDVPSSSNKYQTITPPSTAAQVGIASNEKVIGTVEVK
jgi:hypothetical protein